MKKSHLVLHLDINETILIGDEAGGDSTADCLNKILAKASFVRMPGGPPYDYERTSYFEPTAWWDGTPILDDYSNNLRKPPPALHTDWDWPEGCCPYYRTKFKRRAKTFVSHHGSIYKDLYDRMEKILHADEVGENAARIGDDESLGCNSHFIPALFETIKSLSGESSRSYTIVFRTMGSDLPVVANVINNFAAGRHPSYPDFCDDRLHLGPKSLVQGRWKEVGHGRHVYQLWRDGRVLASGDSEVVDFLHSTTICGIQDDYGFWKKNNYEPWSGKPVWIPSDRRYHHLLFDDNIYNLESYGIASIRRQNSDDSFDTLTSRDILQNHGVHLVRVPTLKPMLNPHWFLEMIAAAQTKYYQTL